MAAQQGRQAVFARMAADLMRMGASTVEVIADSLKMSTEPRGSVMPSIVITRSSELTISRALDIAVDEVVDQIERQESDPGRLSEAKRVMATLKSELQTEHPRWERVSPAVTLAARTGQGAFQKLLPFITKLPDGTRRETGEASGDVMRSPPSAP